MGVHITRWREAYFGPWPSVALTRLDGLWLHIVLKLKLFHGQTKGFPMNRPEIESVSIRFPRKIKDWLRREAANNYRSQNSEVLAILQEKMNAGTGTAA